MAIILKVTGREILDRGKPDLRIEEELGSRASFALPFRWVEALSSRST